MIVVLDYGMGNLRSVSKALEYLGAEVKISRDSADIDRAEKLILPGVGAFGVAMGNLRSLGLIGCLRENVLEKRKPFLGICLGMQLLAERSYEMGAFEGLGWIRGEVKKLDAEAFGLKVPHVGWNEVSLHGNSPLLKRVRDGTSFYFVHSYHLEPDDQSIVTARCSYGQEFAASIQKENIFATQFHPEKSQKDGLRVLENFIELGI